MKKWSWLLLGLAMGAAQAATIGALVDGQVTQLLVKEGELVKKGQLLLEIDSQVLSAQMLELKTKIKQTELELKDAKVNLEAEKALYDQSATAKRRYDAFVLASEYAQAKVNVLKAELAQVQARLAYHMIKAPFDAKVSKVWVQLGDTVFHENQKMIELEAQ